jgi:hypothetical protein
MSQVHQQRQHRTCQLVVCNLDSGRFTNRPYMRQVYGKLDKGQNIFRPYEMVGCPFGST